MSQQATSRESVVGYVEGDRLVDPWRGGKGWRLSQGFEPGTWLQAQLRGSSSEDALMEESALAAPGTALARIYELASRKAPRSPVHTRAAMVEADAWLRSPGIDDPSLVDLAHLPLVTIDEVHSKDLDQALCIQRRDDGYRVWYAIADAAHFIRPETALWKEALARGSTFYLPGLVIPMLPKPLSEYLVSIHPLMPRRALMFRVDLDGDGAVIECQILRARVRSHLKTSYDAVQGFLDGKVKALGGGGEVHRSLELLREVGELRMALAESRDTVQIRRQELRIDLNHQSGLGFIAMTDPRNDVERYNEQISLLCNTEGARFLRRGAEDESLQAIYRFHQPPDQDRLVKLERQIEALVGAQAAVRRGVSDLEVWKRGHQSLAAYLRSLPVSGEGSRAARAIHRQAILAGGRSGFDAVPRVHHGVGADVYARFTAPMREMVGVFVHKETWEGLGKAPASDARWDESIRQAVMAGADRARQTQREIDRELNRLVIDEMFAAEAQLDLADRPQHRGTILGISRSKVHLQLDEPPIDVKIYQHHIEEQLGGEDLHVSRNGVSLRRNRDGKALWSVGAEARLRVREHDSTRDRWNLELMPND